MGMEYKFDPTDDILKMAGDFEILQNKVDDALAPAIKAGAKLIEDAQKRIAPVGTRKSKEPHGRLRNFITTFWRTKKGVASAYIGLDLKNHPEIRDEAVANEFGRKAGTSKTGKKVGAMAARPFVRAGFDVAAEEASQRAAEVFLDKVGFKK